MADLISDPLLVVAIDFGTTYSGYAFQFKHDYSRADPTNKISAPQSWNDGKLQVASMKTPTCLLLNKNRDIDSFGYEAERKFSELCEEEEQKDWYFFRRFKMNLHKLKVLSPSTTVTDEQQKEVPAIEVFSKSILCLKNKLLDELNRKETTVKLDDMLFVLTVPAIWSDNAKDFMRQAATMAGIKDSNLTISLEPESASLYCQYLPVDRFSIGGEAQCALAAPGTVYMIADLGGGTADITVHEKLKDDKLREVHRACGGPWGGAAVDGYFIQLLTSIITPLGMAEFMYNRCGDYLDLMREFEVIKRNVDITTNKTFNVKIPASLSEISKQHLNGKSFAEAVAASPHAGDMKVLGDKLKMSADKARGLFQLVVEKVVCQLEQCINDVNNMASVGSISLILMVGGYSESPFVQQSIKNRFEGSEMKVLIPEEAGLAVLKGAVIFGRQPESICSRILRYTYGAEITPAFDPAVHDENKRTADGKRCNNVFRPFIDQGKEITHGFALKTIYHTTTAFQKSIALKIFSTETDSSIKYTTDKGSNFVGTLTMKINPTKELQDLKVEYVFGGTELYVIGTEVKTNQRCETMLKMND